MDESYYLMKCFYFVFVLLVLVMRFEFLAVEFESTF